MIKGDINDCRRANCKVCAPARGMVVREDFVQGPKPEGGIEMNKQAAAEEAAMHAEDAHMAAEAHDSQTAALNATLAALMAARAGALDESLLCVTKALRVAYEDTDANGEPGPPARRAAVASRHAAEAAFKVAGLPPVDPSRFWHSSTDIEETKKCGPFEPISCPACRGKECAIGGQYHDAICAACGFELVVPASAI
jgi:hypothetical protein